jgi:hypothetical protein
LPSVSSRRNGQSMRGHALSGSAATLVSTRA